MDVKLHSLCIIMLIFFYFATVRIVCALPRYIMYLLTEDNSNPQTLLYLSQFSDSLFKISKSSFSTQKIKHYLCIHVGQSYQYYSADISRMFSCLTLNHTVFIYKYICIVFSHKKVKYYVCWLSCSWFFTVDSLTGFTLDLHSFIMFISSYSHRSFSSSFPREIFDLSSGGQTACLFLESSSAPLTPGCF